MRAHYIVHTCTLTTKDSSSGESGASGWGVSSHGGSFNSTVDNASSSNYSMDKKNGMHGLQFYTFIPTLCLSRFSKATLLFFVGSGTASILDLFGAGLGKIVGTASDLSRDFFLYSTPRLSASLISASKQCSSK